MTGTATKTTAPRWSGVKTKLVECDRAGLIGLVQDLYAASRTIKPSSKRASLWAAMC
jgi:hypothetical protein